MGMCKLCKEVYKTETMNNGFCQNCFGSNEYKKELELINNGTREIEKIKTSRSNWIIVFITSSIASIFLLFFNGNQLGAISLVFAAISLMTIFSLTLDLNKEKVEKVKNSFSMIINKIFISLFIGAITICYFSNFHAIYTHWDNVLTVSRAMELIGVIIPPIGVITGLIHIL